MVTFLSLSVPLNSPSTKPVDIHQAMVLTSSVPVQQPTSSAIPRRGGGIRGQSKLVSNLQNLPETVLANPARSKGNSSLAPSTVAAMANTTAKKTDTLEGDTNTNDIVVDLEEELEDEEADPVVSNRWIDETKARFRKVDASMHASIEDGVFGRERTEGVGRERTEGVETDRETDADEIVEDPVKDSSDEVHVVGVLTDNKDEASTRVDLREKQQPGEPDEVSSLQDENARLVKESLSDEVHVIGAQTDKVEVLAQFDPREKQQPGGPDEESTSQDVEDERPVQESSQDQDTAEMDAPGKQRKGDTATLADVKILRREGSA
jgi:hypothetical protein